MHTIKEPHSLACIVKLLAGFQFIQGQIYLGDLFIPQTTITPTSPHFLQQPSPPISHLPTIYTRLLLQHCSQNLFSPAFHQTQRASHPASYRICYPPPMPKLSTTNTQYFGFLHLARRRSCPLSWPISVVTVGNAPRQNNLRDAAVGAQRSRL